MAGGVIYERNRTGELLRAIVSQAPEVVADQYFYVALSALGSQLMSFAELEDGIRIRYVEHLPVAEMEKINHESPLELHKP